LLDTAAAAAAADDDDDDSKDDEVECLAARHCKARCLRCLSEQLISSHQRYHNATHRIVID